MTRHLEPSALPARTTIDVAGDGGSAPPGQSGRPVGGPFRLGPAQCRVVRLSDGGGGEFAGRLRSLAAETPEPREDMSATEGVGARRLYRLVLLVAGDSRRSRQTAENLRLVCNEHLHGRFDLRIIDIREQPELAMKYQVVATPTLLKLAPEPVQRIIGDLSDTQRVLDALDISGR